MFSLYGPIGFASPVRSAHESSAPHKAAWKLQPEGPMETSDTVVCRGLLLSEGPGLHTLMGSNLEVLEKWWLTGCIMYVNSGLQNVVLEASLKIHKSCRFGSLNISRIFWFVSFILFSSNAS